MTCPNFNVKIVKTHDCKFWCCDEFKKETEYYWKGEYRGNWVDRKQWNFCPHCGSKLR